LGGSVAAGTATETSDLDITVLLSGPPAPFRHSETIDGWLVEWFVQTEESLLRFCDEDRTRRRRPTTMRLVGSSIVLVDADGSGLRLQQDLHRMDRQGPPSIAVLELENQRYAVTDLLADLTGAQSDDERLTVATALVWATADLLLAVSGRWSGSGKWLMRELQMLDIDQATTYAAQLVRGLRGVATGDPVLLRSTVIELLATAGGPLFDGYHRGSDATDSNETVQICPGDIDEPGVAELLAYAVGENSNQFEDIVQAYREDPAVELLVATINHEPVGVLGHRVTSEIEVLHIATALDRRRAGVGSRLLGALPHTRGHRLPIVAETDSDAVGFYAANNFTITSLGEKHPGVERFRVSLRSSADTTADDRAECDMGTGRSGWSKLRMAPKPEVRLRAATPDDGAFIVEMTRHACVIEDRPLPDPDDDEVREMLPPPGVVPIIAEDESGLPVGAVWTYYRSPPLRCDAAGVALPELCIGVAPGRRGAGIGGRLLVALFADLAPDFDAMCANVHVRNPAKRLYERTGFRVVGQGNGPLGLAMVKDLR
jgi:ribosomal protein S18 acetylase RimI-like enzyme